MMMIIEYRSASVSNESNKLIAKEESEEKVRKFVCVDMQESSGDDFVKCNRKSWDQLWSVRHFQPSADRHAGHKLHTYF